jgi:hypothetical protein
LTRDRRVELTIAAAGALFAAATSPWAIQYWTGRPVLNVRVTAVSLALDLFLLSIAFAIAARGRLRQIGFHLMLWTFPLALLAGLEVAAIAVNLADRIVMFQDRSVMRNWARWPGYMLSEARWAEPVGDTRVYRPWQSDGVLINALGLRTAAPTPKAADEWRIAITGGSAVSGWGVFDPDTIASRLQNAINIPGKKVTVYNFGIDGASLLRELATLRRFREVYAIDQVAFYTGANDALIWYLARHESTDGLDAATAQATGFELIRAVKRLMVRWSDPASVIGPDDLAAISRKNALRDGIEAATRYCEATGLRCDFFLQPLILSCKSPACLQSELARGVARIYPGLDLVSEQTFATALATARPGHIADLRDVFDQTTRPVYADMVHVNEDGNQLIAERIAKFVNPR